MEYLLGLYEKAMPMSISLEDKLFLAKDAGYDFLELSIDETEEKMRRLDWPSLKRRNLFLAINTTGIQIKTMCLSCHRKYPFGSEDTVIRAKSLEVMQKAILLASDLGIRIIQLAGYDNFYCATNSNTQALFIDGLHASVEWASTQGVTLAFETMETEFMNTVAKAMKYVEFINSSYLQVYPDIGNLTNAAIQYSGNVSSDLLCAKGHIVAIHLKETMPGRYREVPYGSGHVNFAESVRTSLSLGVRMFLAEFWYVGNEDWKEQLKISSIFLRNKILEASNNSLPVQLKLKSVGLY